MAAPQVADDDEFIVHDFDGDFYLVGNQGEVEEDLSYRHVVIREADAKFFALGTTTDYRTASQAIKNTIRLNYWYLVGLVGDYAVTEVVARRCAYMRVLGLCKGWGDTANNHAGHNCLFNDIKIVSNNTTYNVVNAKAGTVPATATGDVQARGHVHAVPAYGDVAENDWRQKVKLKLLNIVCLVAFFMRTRGHHWIQDMDERYMAIWRKCLYDEDEPGLEWKHLAHTVFHFIYPDVLDAIWLDACDSAKCAGALIKRRDSFPAGIAAVGAVATGAADISIVFPAIRNLVPDAYEELNRCERVAESHRWAGCVNRRFYNGPDLTVNEKKIGALAAVILSAYDGIASNAPLKDSLALQRVAANARITGALISNMIQKAITDERMIDPLFLEAEEED